MSDTPIKILFLSANPYADLPNLDTEHRRITEALEGRPGFQIVSRDHVFADQIQKLLLDIQPHILHFAGHGTKSGSLVTQAAQGGAHKMPLHGLAAALHALRGQIPTRMVVLNACWSLAEAETLCQEVDAVVGMTDEIDVEAAVRFAEGFYLALGREINLAKAVESGKAQIDLSALPDSAVPGYLVRRGLTPTDVRFGDPLYALETLAPSKRLDGDLYVFISYARPQAALASQIERYLREAGVRVFRDNTDIEKGANWDMTIEQALREANRMVLLLSKDSMPFRKEVHREWFDFDQEGKPIYPLYVEACTLHSRMKMYNYIDLRTQGLARTLESLLDALGKPFTRPAGQSDPFSIDERADARPLPDLLALLLATLRDPKGHAALSSEQVRQIVNDHKPHTLTEYRLTRAAEWSQPKFQIDQRFVSLTLLVDQGEDVQGVRWAAPENRRFNDLGAVMAARPDDPALVLLGAPGSGKSTLLRRLQWADAVEALRQDGAASRVTYFAPLNAYRAEAGTPRAWLNALWTERYPHLPGLDALLAEGRMLLLLDALNEMPHTSTRDYHERVGHWRAFLQEIVPRGNRVVFSCRSLDYSASLSSRELRVPQVVVQPMGDAQIEEFLRAYLPGHGEAVWAELKDKPQREVFRTPYFLKLLCEQVENGGVLPTGRAALFAGYVRGGLEREIGDGNPLFFPNGLLTRLDHQKMSLKQWRSAHDLPERGALLKALATLAFAMQEKGLDTESAQVRIVLEAACELLAHARDEDILRAGVALNVLDEDVGRGEILFFHQLLQEFFAARRLATQPDPGLVRVEWQAARVSPSLAETLAGLADSDPLPPLPQTGWEETTILAASMAEAPDRFVSDLMAANLPLAGRCAAAPEVHITPALKRRIQDALIARTQDGTADLRARIAAGEALGILGDPRFERRTGPFGDYLMPPLVTIPAGEYPMGTRRWHIRRPNNEKPRHTVTLEAFQIGMFPVTNAEYALFMASGGYDDPRWWDDLPEAEAWRTGQGSTEGSKQAVRDARRTLQVMSEGDIRSMVVQNRATTEQVEDYIEIRNMAEPEFEAMIDEWFPSGKVYRQPEYWDDAAYNNPAQPVVGISWFEARAYGKWLTAQAFDPSPQTPLPQGERGLNSFGLGTGMVFRLPSEAEYEAAARGKAGRAYAFGDTFDVARANTFESHIRRTTAVGIFENATPEGALDLTGNVWTWTRSIYDPEAFPYPYHGDDGWEAEDRTGVRRALRGGSWVVSSYLARAGYRNGRDPYPRGSDLGCRLVVVFLRPPSHGH